MDNLSLRSIIKWVFVGALYLVCTAIGLTILLSVAEALLAFASTGVCAVIIAIAAWRLYVNYIKAD